MVTCTVLPLAFASGCAEPAERGQLRFVAGTDSAPDTLRYDALPDLSAPSVPARLEVLLPGESNAPHLVFGEVGGVTLVENDVLAVLDRFAAEVKVLAADGTLRTVLGRRGQGPGELSGELTLGLLALSGRRLALPDAGRGVIAIYPVDGSHSGSIPWDISVTAIPEWRSWAGDTAVVRAVDQTSERLLLRELEGSHVRPLMELPRIHQGPTERDRRWPLMPDHWAWDVGKDGTGVAARLSRPEIWLFRDGTVRTVISWPHPAASLTDADVENLLRIVARNQGVTDGGIPAELRQLMATPERLHALADVRIGPSGVIMVQRLRPTSEMDRRILSTMGARGFGGPEWDVFARDGKYRGVLTFPGNVELFEVRGDTLLGVLEGEMDTPHVFLARFPPELTGG
jgi:hypothetical protein